MDNDMINVYSGNKKYKICVNDANQNVIKNSIGDYVQDGLIFCLDGIDKGTNEGYWTDLVKKLQFTTTNTTSYYYGYQFSSTSDMKTPSTTNFQFPSTGQLEVVCESATSGTQIVAMPQGNNQLAFGFYGSKIIRSSYASWKTCNNPITAGTLANYSVNSDNGWCNGNKMTLNTDTNNFTGVSNYIHVGRRNNGNNYSGKICSIRVYNRKLTQEEIQHNYNVDRYRFGFNLPYDAEVEYLQSGGTQYINLGICLNSKAYVEIDYTSTTYTHRLGSENTSTSGFYSFKSVDNSTRFYYNATSSSAFTQAPNNRYKCIQDANNYVLYNSSGTSILSGSFTAADFEVNRPYTLFGINSNGTITKSSIKIHHYLIKNKGIIYDLIPVRIGSIGYMYDKISGKLYGNDGTDNFTLGPDVKVLIKNYDKRVEYIQSDSNQIINIGMPLLGTDTVHVIYVSLNNTSSFVFSCDYSIVPKRFALNAINYYYYGNKYNSFSYEDEVKEVWLGNDIFKYGNNILTIGSSSTDFTTNKNLYLFSNYNGSYKSSIKLVKLEVIDINSNKKLDLIPVRIGTIGYMFDNISGRLFSNSGTGSFVLGPDVT